MALRPSASLLDRIQVKTFGSARNSRVLYRRARHASGSTSACLVRVVDLQRELPIRGSDSLSSSYRPETPDDGARMKRRRRVSHQALPQNSCSPLSARRSARSDPAKNDSKPALRHDTTADPREREVMAPSWRDCSQASPATSRFGADINFHRAHIMQTWKPSPRRSGPGWLDSAASQMAYRRMALQSALIGLLLDSRPHGSDRSCKSFSSPLLCQIRSSRTRVVGSRSPNPTISR